MENELNLEKIKELLEKDPKLFFETDLELVIVKKFLELLKAIENGEIETGEYFNTKLKLVNNLTEEIIDTGILFDFEEEVYGYTELDLFLKDEEDATDFKETDVTFELGDVDSDGYISISKDDVDATLLFDKLFNIDTLSNDLFYLVDTNGVQQEHEKDSTFADKFEEQEQEQLTSNFVTVVLEGVIDFYNNEIDYKEAVNKLEQLGYSFDKLVNKKVDSIELVELVTMFNLDYDKLLVKKE